MVRDASFGLSEAEQLFVRALGLRERLLAACAASPGAGTALFAAPALPGVLGEAEGLFDPRRWGGVFENLADGRTFWGSVCALFKNVQVQGVLGVSSPESDPEFYADALAPVLARFAGLDVFAAKQRAYLATREADALDPRLLRAEILKEKLGVGDFFRALPKLSHSTSGLVRAALAALLVRSPAVSGAAALNSGEEVEEGSGGSEGGAASAVSSANFGGTDAGDAAGSVVGPGVDFDREAAEVVVGRLWGVLSSSWRGGERENERK